MNPKLKETSYRQDGRPSYREYEYTSHFRVYFPFDLGDVERNNKNSGGHWFDRDTMRFFSTRINSGLYRGGFFITTDQRGFGAAAGRGYNVRMVDPNWYSIGSMNEVGEPFRTRKQAEKYIKQLQMIGRLFKMVLLYGYTDI